MIGGLQSGEPLPMLLSFASSRLPLGQFKFSLADLFEQFLLFVLGSLGSSAEVVYLRNTLFDSTEFFLKVCDVRCQILSLLVVCEFGFFELANSSGTFMQLFMRRLELSLALDLHFARFMSRRRRGKICLAACQPAPQLGEFYFEAL